MNQTASHGRPPVIVVGIAGERSDPVVLRAAELARDLGGSIVCAHVDTSRYPAGERPDGSVDAVPIDPDLPELEAGRFDPALGARLARLLEGGGAPYTFRLLAGEPAHALARLADTVDARFIAVGTRRPPHRHGLGDFFTGSVAVQLAHRQPRPVLVVPLSPVGDDGALFGG